MPNRGSILPEENNRPWGHYQILADEADHKVKRITVLPGNRLSLQRHQHRAEHWYIIRGNAIVTLEDKQLSLGPGDSVNIASGALHRIMNASNEEIIFIEVQTGSYFGEDDIERLQDDFGRI